ncbi:hypothetical protein KFE25_009404 [Diacronema lutheri]|uniref:Uncharacterized protein n=1 Tax=Diacronema lutheri TaxID=2081491 RepID=A0A8J5XSP5_DIALT|nr:hypothetical protein KFE25_009404 [Diacronema lutheri]
MRSLVALLALAVAEVAAAASRPHVSFSFINSPLVPRDALQLLQPPSRAPTQMSAAVGLDAGSLLGQIVALPFRLLIKFGALLGSLVPDRLPSFWTVPEAGEHLIGAASILFSNFFYIHYALQQFRSRRPFLGLLLLAAAGASIVYHGAQILHGASACLTHKACFVDTSIAVGSGLVYIAKCGLPRPHLSAAACCTFFIGPSCAPLYALSHSAWHFVSAYTAWAMAEGAHQNHARAKRAQLGGAAAAPLPQLPSPAAAGAALRAGPHQRDATATATALAPTPATTATATPIAATPRRALGRARLRMAARDGAVGVQLQRRAWARWRRLSRARGSARPEAGGAGGGASSGAGGGAHGQPLPAAVRPLAALIADCAGAVVSAARALLAAPFALGGALAAAFAAERAESAGVAQRLGALGSALVALPSRVLAGLDSLAKLVSSAFPAEWRHAARGVAQRASESMPSSKLHLLQLLLWKHARGARRVNDVDGAALRFK